MVMVSRFDRFLARIDRFLGDTGEPGEVPSYPRRNDPGCPHTWTKKIRTDARPYYKCRACGEIFNNP